MNVAQFRNRVTQEIQENQAQAQIAQEKAAELKKLEQRKTEITAELAKLNEDTRNKFTLAVQNQIRDLKTELSSVEAQLEKLNSGK
jgi:predicted nuclease with TOPRIM domain